MDRRKLVTALGQALPGIGWGLIPAIFGLEPAVSPWIVAAVLLVIGLGFWALYWVFIEPHLHPTTAELQANLKEMQDALDKLINYRFITDGADLQIKPAKGLSRQQLFVRHAPADFRESWYEELGLPKPALRRDRAR
jgi:hypothetical protein